MSIRVFLGATSILALSILAGCHSEAVNEAEAPRLPAEVGVAAAVMQEIASTTRLTGRVVPPAGNLVVLAPQAEGRLASVDVREGDAVTKGAVLARVDTGLLESAARAAAADERRAGAEVGFKRGVATRTAELVTKGVAAQQDADGDAAALVAAEADLARAQQVSADARRRLDWAILRAPSDGVALHVLRQRGEVVDGTSATPVVELVLGSAAEIAIGVPAEILSRLVMGGEASVMLPGVRVPLRARISRIPLALDPGSATGELRLTPDAASVALLFGSSADVVLSLGSPRQALVVPPGAIRRDDAGQTEVLVLDAGTCHVHPVIVGETVGAGIEILSGVDAGAIIVVDDPTGIEDGTPLRARAEIVQ